MTTTTQDEPTSVWTVTTRDGDEITRVFGGDYATASTKAQQIPAVAESMQREHGFGLRRLYADDLDRATIKNEIESNLVAWISGLVSRKEFAAENRRLAPIAHLVGLRVHPASMS